ncbi:MAG: hypothetical protein NT118_03280 [Lentisphaerae bacterium]|nr:hypothetical protein [Lentisphaerota bacterium]
MGEIQQIRYAIGKVVIDLKSQAELCRRADIDKSNLHKFLIGKVKTMELEMFFRLYPHIKKHLPNDFFANTECEKICSGLGNMEKGFMKELKLFSKDEKTKLWKFYEDVQEERLKNRTANSLSNSAKSA